MGICFGVSLLSSNGPLNNMSNSVLSNMQSDRSIDMATATNVFDFLLTNQSELFPEEINFSQPAKTNPGYSTLSRSTGSTYNSNSNNNNSVMKVINESFSNLSLPESPMANKLNLTSQNDSLNDLQINPNNSSPFQRVNINTFNSSSPLTNSSNLTNLNRHCKKSSYESRLVENELFASNNSLNSVGSASNFTSNKSAANQSPLQTTSE